MLKLYKFTDTLKSYWETWDNDGLHTIHWGTLGTRGSSRDLKSSLFKKATSEIQKEIDKKVADGFRPIEKHSILMIEFAVAGMGSGPDVDKRYRLEERMNEMLGWTGLGHCDGGSIGSGTMEVCCLVVDSDTAKKVIEADLKNTEFNNYTRIYCEDELTA